MKVLCSEKLKNFNDLLRSRIRNARNGSWCSVVVDAVDEGSVVECDKVVGREGGRVGVVCKFLHELEGRTVASDSANGVLWLTCREHEY